MSEEHGLDPDIPWDDGGVSGDDFTARTSDGYILRVEQMDKDYWWWQVYYPDGSQADPYCDLSVFTAYAGKRLCESILKLHRQATVKQEKP